MKPLHDEADLVGAMAKRLANLDNQLSEDTEEFRPWRNMLHGLVGAVYALHQAIPLLSHEKRCFEMTSQEAHALMAALRQGSDIAVSDAKLWFVGHFLNNAESRISSVLHQVLKAALSCKHADRLYVPRLVEIVLYKIHCNKKCGHEMCEQLPLDPSNKVRAILWKIHRKKKGYSLFQVHCWTNGLKHDQVPEVDNLPPSCRWETDHNALSDLVNLYTDFAQCSGCLTIPKAGS